MQNIDRPSGQLRGRTFKWKTVPENTYIILSEHEGKLAECFVIVGKGGQTVHGLSEALGRVLSLAMRAGVDLDELIDQLKNIGGADPVWDKGQLLQSIPHCIALSIEQWKKENTESEVER